MINRLRYKRKEYILYKLFITFFLMSIISTSSMGNKLFYSNWLLGVLLIYVFLGQILINKKIDKKIIWTWLLMSIWLLPPFFATNFDIVIDTNRHLTNLVLTLFYITVNVVLSSYLLKNKKILNKVFLYSNIIWICINSTVLIMTLLGIYSKQDIAFSGISQNRNEFAIITTVLISYLMFFRDHYAKKKLVNILIVMSFILIICTLSNKGVIGWLIISYLSIIHNTKLKVSKFKKYTSLLLLFCIVVSIILIDNPLRDRMNRYVILFTSPEKLRINESAYLRMYYLRKAINIIKQYPLTGIGIDNSKYYLYPPLSNIGTYSHNNYIETLLNGGIFSFFLYYTPLFIIFLKLKKMKDRSKIANYLYCILLYKLFIDFGAVTYKSMSMSFLLALIYYEYFNINKKKDDANDKIKGK